jgi:NADH:ubiquinone oxidoreductase subunit E
LDLHLIPGAVATPEERAAIDAVLASSHAAPGTAPAPKHLAPKHLAPQHPAPSTQHLAPALCCCPPSRRARACGWISEGALNYICERLSVPPAEAFGVASFYALFSLQPRPPLVVHVCDDIACRANGAEGICQDLGRRVGAQGESLINAGAMWLRSPCLGQCDRAPAALVQRAGKDPRDWTMTTVTADDIVAILSHEKSDVASDVLSRRSRAAAEAEPRSTRIRPACSAAPASLIRRTSTRTARTAATRPWRARWTWVRTPSSAK